MTLRLYVDSPLAAGELELPAGAARHVQVRRLQPGDALVLFDGRGGEWEAVVVGMGRRTVAVQVGARRGVDREAAISVEIAFGMPAGDRMDALIEKATELGVTTIRPLHTERSVLRLPGERAARRRDHWEAVAVAAAEQCGRTRVPEVCGIQTLDSWLAGLRETPEPGVDRVVLQPGAPAWTPIAPGVRALHALSGPEGGLSGAEQAAAQVQGFRTVSLGPRVLRADTAPLLLLALAIGGQ